MHRLHELHAVVVLNLGWYPSKMLTVSKRQLFIASAFRIEPACLFPDPKGCPPGASVPSQMSQALVARMHILA